MSDSKATEKQTYTPSALGWMVGVSFSAMVVVGAVSVYAINRIGHVTTSVAVNGQADLVEHVAKLTLALDTIQQPATVQSATLPNPTFPTEPVLQSAPSIPAAAYPTPISPTQAGMVPVPAAPYPTPAAAAAPAPNPDVILQNPEVVGQLMDSFQLAAGITEEGEIDQAYPIIAFFDPRCPYCHAAYKALSGKVTIKWLPTLALGQPETGEPIIAGLLGQTEAAMEGGEIVNVTLPDDPERVTRLATLLSGERAERGETAEVTDAVRFVLEENIIIMQQLAPLAGGAPFGVPTFIVPHPDGTASFITGWDPENGLQQITSAYSGGQ